jgi:hypothetical protein
VAPRLRSPVVPALLLAAVLAGACGDDGAAGDDDGSTLPATGCGDERQERVDPGSATHVLAGGAEPDSYATDPPTSGPHVPGPPRSGVLDEPLTRPEQVGHLEAGGILLQHDGLTEAQVEELAGLAGEEVAIVPNPDLPAPIVATAWLRTMRCSTPDLDALDAFVVANVGRAPGSDG